MKKQAKDNNNRMSWGVVAWMRRCARKRRSQGKEFYTDFFDLANFPGFPKAKDRSTFNFKHGPNTDVFKAKFIPIEEPEQEWW